MTDADGFSSFKVTHRGIRKTVEGSIRPQSPKPSRAQHKSVPPPPPLRTSDGGDLDEAFKEAVSTAGSLGATGSNNSLERIAIVGEGEPSSLDPGVAKSEERLGVGLKTSATGEVIGKPKVI